MAKPRHPPDSYTVGWVCALPVEFAAAQKMLDEEHQDPYDRRDAHGTTYAAGCVAAHNEVIACLPAGQTGTNSVAAHNVVIACLPAGQTGTNSAAAVAIQLKSRFPSIRFGLMVGIGGGAPSSESDIRLGDIVVSQPHMGHGGVVQYDFGKALPGRFLRRAHLNAPPIVLLNALAKLQADHLVGESHLSTSLSKFNDQPRFTRNNAGPDVLFHANYKHTRGATCASCNQNNIIRRTPRGSQEVVVHYGTIASGNQVIRDGVTRDRLSAAVGGVLCFEMEAAGLMNCFPCLVVRGICDYADSHKNKNWQPYAAAAAASYAKAVLSVIPAAEVASTQTIDDAILSDNLLSTIDTVELETFLKMLSVAGQDQDILLRSNTSLLGCEINNQPEFSWIFRNVDFELWDTSASSQVLWLSGPPKCNLRHVSSHIVNREKTRVSNTQNFVLYFFCSSESREEIINIFIRTLLHQTIMCLSSDERILIVRKFLHCLLKGILRNKVVGSLRKQGFKEDLADSNLKKILQAPDSELCSAFGAVLGGGQQEQLWIVVDGIGQGGLESHEFIRGLRALIQSLQEECPSKVKVLFTSKYSDTENHIDGLPCIEYDKERKECLANLQFDNTRHQKISSEHKGTLEWIWKDEAYKSWATSERSQLLYIQGKPGSGKSTLTKYINHHLLERDPTAKSAIRAKFFYSFRDGQLQRSHFNMLRTILHDILEQDEAFFYHCFQKKHRHLATLRAHGNYNLIEQEYNLLQELLLSLQDYRLSKRLYLIIDAVDESDNNDRRKILELLVDLCSRMEYGVVKIFIASRPVALLDRHIGKFQFIKLQDRTKSDISTFAYSFLNRLDFDGFLEKAADYIVENAQGVFLWVQLVGEELLDYDAEGRAEEEVFEFLKRLPIELEDFYERMLNNIGRKSVDLRDGMKMFQFALFGFRPLFVSELLHALGIWDDLDTPSDQRFKGRIPPERRIIYCGGNFLEIKEHQGNRIVQVMHQTVREFFLRPGGYVAKSEFSMGEKDAHNCISKTCIRYLMLCTRETLYLTKPCNVKSWTSEHLEDFIQYFNSRPLLPYAMSYLKQHIEACGRDIEVLGMASQFIDGLLGSPAIIYFLGLWVNSALDRNWSPPANRDILVAIEFKHKLLLAAARKGFPVAVEVLFKAGIDVNVRLNAGRTALWHAADAGHETVVRALLSAHDIAVHSKDDEDQTPLLRAAQGGHEGIVRLLLSRNDVHADSGDKDKQTALGRAAHGGHEGVVSLLLERKDVDPNTRDCGNRSPLWNAAEGGHTAIVKLLLSLQDVDADASDHSGRTPLSRAAEKGHEAVVRLLLSHRDVDPNSKDKMRWTPLSQAAKSGHEAIVKILLACRDVAADLIDENGQTPLWRAAARGHEGVVKVLLAREDVEPDFKDYSGRTPLSQAIEGGHERIVRLLEENIRASRQKIMVD